jgi:hypothetical protein
VFELIIVVQTSFVPSDNKNSSHASPVDAALLVYVFVEHELFATIVLNPILVFTFGPVLAVNVLLTLSLTVTVNTSQVVQSFCATRLPQFTELDNETKTSPWIVTEVHAYIASPDASASERFPVTSP